MLSSPDSARYPKGVLKLKTFQALHDLTINQEAFTIQFLHMKL